MQPCRARVSAITIERRGLRASSVVTSACLFFGDAAYGSSVFMVCDPVAASFASNAGVHTPRSSTSCREKKKNEAVENSILFLVERWHKKLDHIHPPISDCFRRRVD